MKKEKGKRIIVYVMGENKNHHKNPKNGNKIKSKSVQIMNVSREALKMLPITSIRSLNLSIFFFEAINFSVEFVEKNCNERFWMRFRLPE